MSTNAQQTNRVAEFLNHPLFKWGTNEGFVDYTFGIRSGPCLDVKNLIHEVAHVAQLRPKDIPRVNQRGYGFTSPSNLANLVNLPCTRREAEVMAIQIVLQAAILDIHTDPASLARLYVWFPDHEFVPGCSEDSRVEHVVQMIEGFIEVWPLSRILNSFSKNLYEIHARKVL